MAKSKYNVVMHNASGIVGDLLEFKQRFGKTIIAKRRTVNFIPNAEQLDIQKKFRKAAAYAKSVQDNPLVRVLYEGQSGEGVTAFNLAFRDYFKAPQVEAVDTDAYTGAVGTPIKIVATDDFLVKSVDVVITAADGSLLEHGAAIQQSSSSGWTYLASVINPLLPGSKIRVSAKDLPGNTTIEEKTLI